MSTPGDCARMPPVPTYRIAFAVAEVIAPPIAMPPPPPAAGKVVQAPAPSRYVPAAGVPDPRYATPTFVPFQVPAVTAPSVTIAVEPAAGAYDPAGW